MTSSGTRGRGQAWPLFDLIVEQASAGGFQNPWVCDHDGDRPRFQADFHTLERLLGVPLLLGAKSTTGIPALALDVWVAFELRRAGFDEDAVWPRASAPRVMPSALVQMIDKATRADRSNLERMASRYTNALPANANILGKNYVKQVDVVISAWNTGPELMISTKRMDSSLGNNAANRVEESYGDAANLRARHPLAALGFVYSLGSAALSESRTKAEWLVDLLGKLGGQDDAYDAVALLVPELVGFDDNPDDESGDGEDRLAAAGFTSETAESTSAGVDGAPDADAARAGLDAIPLVHLLWDDVPERLRPEAFFDTMVTRVLKNSPITFHREARSRRSNPILLSSPPFPDE